MISHKTHITYTSNIAEVATIDLNQIEVVEQE
jgi:hypothetical protein